MLARGDAPLELGLVLLVIGCLLMFLIPPADSKPKWDDYEEP